MKTKPTTGALSFKKYKCKKCGRVESHSTNHWGDIYCLCHYCNTTLWECMEPVPKGYGVPEKWKQVKLGDIADIKEVHT